MTDKDFVIVSELPQQPIREVKDAEGKEYELVLLTEAVKEILETVRELKKGITGWLN